MTGVPAWSVLLVLFGLPLALWPYQVTRAYEIVDAIGRRSAGPVEPAEWYVSLTRLGGIGFLLLGGLGIVTAIA